MVINMTVRIAGIIRESIVDGPGVRFVVFTQGCPHHCPGCHNPESHDPNGGYDCEINKILEEIKKDPLLKGVTFSGGEPFDQPEPLAKLAEKIKQLGLDLFIYTGYLFEALQQREDEATNRLIALADYIVDGPFVLSQRSLELKFRGSSNQRMIDVARTLEAGKVITIEN